MADHGSSVDLGKYSKTPGIQRIHFPFLARLGLLAALGLLILISILPLSLEQQLTFAVSSLVMAILLRTNQRTQSVSRVMLILISCVITGRYIYWRLTETLGWPDPMNNYTLLDCTFSISLLVAEIYAWLTLFLGYFQTLWPLRRNTVSLPMNRDHWPSVDVFIPTYNEPLKVVTSSVLAAKHMDWPTDRLNVYILDDGCRPEFKNFAASAGVHYIERVESTHAKAGNINHALEQVSGDYVAIFDCDHAPVKTFLTRTMGGFLEDERLALVQTPHLFFTPDPVERNLGTFRQVPNEGELFYGLIQDGNDTWNATFFCGSCAVLRREALDEVGGIAVETVTEDAHTSLRIHRRGWNSAYINEPLAAGLATERLSAHVGQRVRWARGMIQIFRLDNPLFGRGLSWGQRFSYFNAMLHFLFSVPRLIFLLAPLAYLFFEAHIIQTTALMIAVYALPHIIQSLVTNSAIQGRYRHAFWAEVYETLLATHIFWPTLRALINPLKGQFNVTDKGGMVDQDHFDWDTVRPIFIILALNVAALIIGIGRLLWWNTYETGTVIMNLCWIGYNLVILGAAVAVAWEKRQLRNNTRIPRQEEVLLTLASGEELTSISTDISLTDMSLQVPHYQALKVGDSLIMQLNDNDQKFHSIHARVASQRGKHVGVKFARLNVSEMTHLVYFTHMRENSWEQWYGNCPPQRSLFSFFEVIHYGFIGLAKSLLGYSQQGSNDKPSMSYTTTCWLLVLLVVVASQWMPGIASASTAEPQNRTRLAQTDLTLENTATITSHIFERRVNLKQMGQQQPVLLRDNLEKNIGFFSIRQDEEVVAAALHLQATLPLVLANDFTRLDIMLNGQVLGSLALDKQLSEEKRTLIVPVEPLWIAEDNNLSVRLVAFNDTNCIALSKQSKAVLLDKQTEMVLSTQRLPLVNDLALLPVPFFDKKDQSSLVLPFVLDTHLATSTPGLQAAAVLSSWFGAQADYRGAYFPVSIGDAPQGHAVVLLTPQNSLPWLATPAISGPSIKLVPHPNDQYAKLLLVMGRNVREVLVAARGLALDKFDLSGEIAVLNAQLRLPARRLYDAPRWLPTDRKVQFAELMDETTALHLKQFPSDVVRVNFRMRPDVFAWADEGIPLQLGYFYSNIELDNNSRLNINVNDKPVGHVTLGKVNQVISRSFWEQQRIKLNGGSQTLIDSEEGETNHSVLLDLPVDMVGGMNHLDLHFDLQPIGVLDSACTSLSTTGMNGGVSGGSSLDLRGFHHFAKLPNLAMFANAGFPFTRYADLSETAVVMPMQPRAEDVQVMLEVLGRFGMATGYPASKVRIVYPNHLESVKNHDLLVIGGYGRQPLYEYWEKYLPMQRVGNHWRQRTLKPWQQLSIWWNNMHFSDWQKPRKESSLVQANETDKAIVLGFQSPLSKNRSVVALWSAKPKGLLAVGEVLNTPEQVKEVQGDLVVIGEDSVSGQQVLPHYHVGDLPPITFLRWYLSHNFIVLVGVFLGTLWLGGLLVKALMQHQAAGRFILKARTS